MERRSNTSVVLSINNLIKTFSDDNFPVLKSISLTLHKNEFLGIIGPSGSGKSTLLKILANLESYDSGKISYTKKNMRMPIVWQEHRLYPWLTVLGNASLGLKLKGLPVRVAEAKAKKYLKMVHLEHFYGHYPHQLSGGMKQRVAMARALAIKPDLLLMDEPFASLDYQTKIILQENLKKLQMRFSIPIIYVTHDIRDAIQLADRLLILSKRPAEVIKEINLGEVDKTNLEAQIWDLIKQEIKV